MLDEVWDVKVEPSFISYSGGICACEKSEHFQQALPLLSRWWKTG